MQPRRAAALSLWRELEAQIDARALMLETLSTGAAGSPPNTLPAAWDPGAALHGRAPDRVLALGKASVAMWEGACAWAGRPVPGLLVIPRGTPGPSSGLWQDREAAARLIVVEAEHPIPGQGSLQAGQALLHAAAEAQAAGEQVWVLLSGGGSSLAVAPRGPGSSRAALAELVQVYRQLTQAGLEIETLNFARAALSRLKGGGLAQALGPSLARTLVLVDIPSGEARAVASGPCSCFAQTERAALLRRLQAQTVWARLAAWVQVACEARAAAVIGEMPEPATAGDKGEGVDGRRAPALERIGDPETLRRAATQALSRRGVQNIEQAPTLQDQPLEAVADALAKFLGAAAAQPPAENVKAEAADASTADASAADSWAGARAYLCVGETRLALPAAPPAGGRAAHLALALLARLQAPDGELVDSEEHKAAPEPTAGGGDERPRSLVDVGSSWSWWLLIAASDGQDGSAGGGVFIDSHHGLDAAAIREALRSFDSGRLLKEAGLLLPRRPPRSNLCDLILAVAVPARV